MIISLRPLHVPADFAALAELLNQVETEPLSAERLAEATRRSRGSGASASRSRQVADLVEAALK